MKQQQNISLSIENPCSENWASMQKTGTGRHCLHCSKNVIDFTGLTDEEILQIITQTNEKLCGRFEKQQLDRVLIVEKERNAKRFKSKWLAGTVLMLGISKSFAGGTTTMRPTAPFVQQIVTGQGSASNENAMPPDTLRNFFRGTLVDSLTKEKLAGVVILLDNADVVGVSDSTGKFNIRIPAHLVTNTLVFTIIYSSYETKAVYISKDQLVNDQEEVFPVFEIKKDTEEVKMEVIMGMSTRTISIEFNERSSSRQKAQYDKEWWEFWKDL